MRNNITLQVLVMCMAVWPMASIAVEKPLLFGIFPYVSPGKLIAHQKGLKDHLEAELGRPISIVTATSVEDYIDNLKQRQYDILFSAPHVARFSEIHAGYQRIAMTTHQIQGSVIVLKGSPYEQIGDLKGKIISMAPPLTILSQAATKLLKDNGLVNGENITINTVSTHNNAIFSVIKGDADAALTGVKLWKNLPPKHKDKLRLLVKTEAVPGFLVMARSDMPATTVKLLQHSIMAYGTQDSGKTYLFHGFKAIDDDTMQQLDAYTSVIK